MYAITHIQVTESSRYGSKELAFITKVGENYHLGFEFGDPISLSIIKNTTSFEELSTPQTMLENQCVWIDKEGKIFITDADNPLNVKNKIFLTFKNKEFP